MTFDASHVLRFINCARAAMGLHALAELPFASAVRADERGCVLARALGCEVGGSDDPAWDGEFVLRLPHGELARVVAAATGQPWNARAEVLLPDAITNLAVGFDHGWISAAGARYVPKGQMCFEDLQLRLVRGTRPRRVSKATFRRARRLTDGQPESLQIMNSFAGDGSSIVAFRG